MGQDQPTPQDSPPPPDAAAIERHREALKRLFPMPRPEELAPRRKAVKTVVGLAVLVVGGLIAWDPGWSGEQYATNIGERRTVALPDGSRVVLDTGSRIATSWHLRSRHVELEVGRARFEVAPSRLRPFRVDAGQASVRVVGTVFDVRRVADDVEVSVFQGHVAVWAGDHATTVMLDPGQGIVAQGQAVGPPTAVDVTARAGWIEGRLEFEGTPLADVLVELQRYRRQRIELADPARLAGLKVSGVFDSSRVDEALDLLPQILPVEVARRSDGSVRVEAR